MNPSPSERRRAQRRAEARQEILAAAQQILVEEDHRELSMRKLGERSGYTAPTLYHYFGDKNGLIDALLESALGELVAEIRREMSGLDPLAGLGVLFESFAHFFLRQPAYYHLLTEPRHARLWRSGARGSDPRPPQRTWPALPAQELKGTEYSRIIVGFARPPANCSSRAVFLRQR